MELKLKMHIKQPLQMKFQIFTMVNFRILKLVSFILLKTASISVE